MCNQAQMNHRSQAKKKTSPDRRAPIGSPMFLIRQSDKQPKIGSTEINTMHINGADFGSYSCPKFNTLMDMGRERSPEQWQGFHANCQLVTTIKRVDGYLAIYRWNIRKRPRMPGVLSVKQIKYPTLESGGRIIEIRHRSEWMHQVEAMTQFAVHLRDNFESPSPHQLHS
ncbi:hypothetical protein M5D96_005822 [Drosophila gunungcola]|uniref:Uncharacterized protein n=1 Tax=Drosophila gunungcola TaxID=103775 RepID=A0A9Q0BR54_9MUSC|nr:hypothetical protein M5D96_005822 [Drosophila gunungcola]